MSSAALALERVMFIDTSKCIGCKACQVACKQWHQLPAEPTTFTGSYTNPPNVSANTFTIVKFTEAPGEGLTSGLKWLFFKEMCRHCFRPKCARVCSTGVNRTPEGFVLFNSNANDANLRLRRGMTSMTDACPYGIPQKDIAGQYFKCDFCYDRFGVGKPNTTACEAACPVKAIKTGGFADIYSNYDSVARNAYRKAKRIHLGAKLYMGKGRGRTNVIYLLTDTPAAYGL